MEIFDIFGPHSHPSAPIDVKFCTAKRTQVPVSPATFDLNRCNESPLRGEKPDFWPVSKNNTGSLPLCGILPVNISYRAGDNTNIMHLNNERIQLETKASSHQRQCIPAGYCHANAHYAGGVNIYLNSNHTKYLAQLCGRFFAFLQISAANLRILWRHLPT